MFGFGQATGNTLGLGGGLGGLGGLGGGTVTSSVPTPVTSSSVGGNKDMEIVQPQQLNGQMDSAIDGISHLSFSPVAEFLAASSWDGMVRCYQVAGDTVLKAAIQHQQPVLSCCWSTDGMKLFSGSADKQAKMLDLSTGQQMQVAQHDGPISNTRFITTPNAQLLVTGSWDKTIKYWDLRQSQAALSVNLPERCYTMDAKFPIFIVGTADRKFQIYDLNNPALPFKEIESPLKYQTRTVSCFPTGDGFAIGSIEGRVAIQYIQEKDTPQNFSFKCHREKEGTQVYAVNSIAFHPVYGTFSTTGSDNCFFFWDKDSRQRLKTFTKLHNTIPTGTFNRNGSIFAYAVSYDWSKGYEHYNPATMKNSIYLHAVADEEIKPRPKTR